MKLFVDAYIFNKSGDITLLPPTLYDRRQHQQQNAPPCDAWAKVLWALPLLKHKALIITSIAA